VAFSPCFFFIFFPLSPVVRRHTTVATLHNHDSFPCLEDEAACGGFPTDPLLAIMSSHPPPAAQSVNPPFSQHPSFPARTGSDQARGDSPSTSTSQSTSHGPQEPSSLRSCVTCRRRKVRCNKRCPCSNCARAGIECTYPPPGRAPRKTKRPQDAELLARLRRLEGVIEHLSEKNAAAAVQRSPEQQQANVPAATQERPAYVPPSTETEENGGCPFNLDPKKPLQPHNLQHEFGRLVIDEGRSRYVSNRFWASLGDEVGFAAMYR
jgi:hypothetical protein